MRKMFLYLAAAAALISCEAERCEEHGYFTEMKNTRLELTMNDVSVETGVTVNSADLRLKLLCEFEYVDIGTYPNDYKSEYCFYRENIGLDGSIKSITVTCDRPIANIEAGEDLISVMNAKIYVKDQYEMTVQEWMDTLNKGYFTSRRGGGVYAGLPYEFDLALIPYYVTVTEDDYVFTLQIDFYSGWKGRPERTLLHVFPAVHLK